MNHWFVSVRFWWFWLSQVVGIYKIWNLFFKLVPLGPSLFSRRTAYLLIATVVNAARDFSISKCFKNTCPKHLLFRDGPLLSLASVKWLQNRSIVQKNNHLLKFKRLKLICSKLLSFSIIFQDAFQWLL